MSKFNITQKVSLEVLGEQHKNDYIELSALTYKEAKELRDLEVDENQADSALDKLLSEKITGGKIGDVEVTSSDVGELPMSVIIKCIEALKGGVPQDLGKA